MIPLVRALALCTLLLGAWSARADEPGAQPEESEPAPEPEQTENAIEWRFAWDGAPTYEMWILTPQLQEKTHEIGVVQDLGLVGRIGGSLLLDYGFVSGEGTGNDWDVELRRLRLETLGAFAYGLETQYKVSFGFEQKKVYLNDFWLAWRPSYIDRLRLGYLDPPFSMEALASSSGRSFMESAAPVLAFAPGYRLGLEARDRFLAPDLSWIASLSSVGQSMKFADASSSPFRASLRAAWRPGGVADDPNAPLVHLAAAVGYSFSGTGDVHYRAQPESSLADYLVDTGKIPGDAGQLGLELARRTGPLLVQAEWIGSWVTSTTAGSRFFSGSYAEVLWAPTGEVQPYDPRSALFGPAEPRSPFSWEKRQLGGLQLAGRISYVDLTDGPVRGGRMLTLNASAMWILNHYVRIHFDGIYANVKDRPGFGSNLIAQMRIELQM